MIAAAWLGLTTAPAALPANDLQAPQASPAGTGTGTGTELVLRALGLLGVNYRWGGNTPDDGLDCSGLVRHVFREAIGLVLPRRAEEMGRAGSQIAPHQLKPGDLVFFNTLRRTFSHVGIYIGNDQFVHAPSTGGVVRVDNMNAQYWLNRFDGARRLVPAEDDTLVVGSALERLLVSMNPEAVQVDTMLRSAAVMPATMPVAAQPRAALAGAPAVRPPVRVNPRRGTRVSARATATSTTKAAAITSPRRSPSPRP